VTLTFRDVKGSNLTADEVDENFRDLDGRVTAVESSPPAPNNIDEITVSGSQMTVIMEDASTHGPFTLPTARWRWREEFADATVYAVEDFFSDPDTGSIYRVLIGHTSATPFDPDLLSGGDPVYELILDASNLGGGLGNFVTKTASFTPAADEANKFFIIDTFNDITVTIPEDATTNFAVGTMFGFIRKFVYGVTTFDHETGSGGLEYADGQTFKSYRDGSVVYAMKIDDDLWRLWGDLIQDERVRTETTNFNVRLDTHYDFVIFDSASDWNAYLIVESSQPFQIGDEITFLQANTGKLTISNNGVGTVVINKKSGTVPRTIEAGSAITVKKVAANTWWVYGDYE
jgi:hypothetical protein